MAINKLSLAQKDFELFKDGSVKDILNEKRYTDITLACNDDKQIDAHRIILSSHSLFFRRILQQNDRRDMLLYLPNASSIELENILEFLYLGQTEVDENDFEKFLRLGKVFEIQILTDLEINCEREPGILLQAIMDSGYVGEGLVIGKSLLKRQPNGKFPCDQCDYQSVARSHVKRHKEGVHFGIKHSCDECAKEYFDLYELRIHKKSAHEGVLYQCEQCNRTFPHPKTLQTHEKEHQGSVTKCTRCEKSCTTVGSLRHHIIKHHDGLKHVCDQCEFKTKRLQSLKEHKGTVHTTSIH